MALRVAKRSGLYKMPLTYHRVHTVYEEVNVGTRLMYRSYVSESDRVAEKGGEDVFHETVDEPVEGWDGPMTVREAYEWLKLLPEFEGAEDC